MANDEKRKVKEANRILYSRIAENYEDIDGRRSDRLLYWLKSRLGYIAELSGGNDKLLDIACGAGFVIKAAQGFFDRIYGIDISQDILKRASVFADGVVCADVDFIPFRAASIDTVVLFAAMHHFYDYKTAIKEMHRILKQDGVLYIDHDMNKEFAKRFKLLRWLYKKLFRRKKKYINAGIDEQTYDLSEFHSDGVDVDKILNYLKELNFTICESYYHWYGLSSFTDNIFKHKRFKRNAPLISIIAKKA